MAASERTITWSHTFPGTERKQDFVAHDDGELVGRIYRMGGGPQNGRWLWFANGIQASPGLVGCALDGEAPTKQAAADAVKEAWTRWYEIKATQTGSSGST